MRKQTESGTGINFLLKEHIDTLASTLTASGAIKTIVDEATQRAVMAEMSIAAAYQNFDVANFRRAEEGLPRITVNVAGNVTSETDLVNTITDQLYNYQKAGRGLIYSSVAI